MKTKHLSDLENKLRTEILTPSQAYTTAHLLSCYWQRHLQPQPSVSNMQCFAHFRLSAGWWKLTEHDGAKRKAAPPLIATRVHQICHEQWHARHNKHLWSQTPRFSLPQNRGCWWQMGRVKQEDWPKSSSCISLPRPEPQFIAETTNFQAPDRKKNVSIKKINDINNRN